MCTIHMTFNLNVFNQLLSKSIDNDIVALKNSLQAIEDGKLPDPQRRSELIVQLQYNTTQLSKNREIAKSYISMIRSFITFWEQIIAFEEFSEMGEKGIMTEYALNGEEEMKKYLDTKYTNLLRSIASNKALNNYSKVALFDFLTPQTRAATLGYIDTRNCLEHHGGSAKKDIELYLPVIVILHNDVEITSLPCRVEAGEQVNMKFKIEKRLIQKNDIVMLSETELEQIGLMIKMIISSEIINGVNERINK